MKILKNGFYFFLLSVLFFLTIFELNGYLAALLLICIVSVLWLIAKQPYVLVPPVAFISVAYIFGYALPMLFPDLYTGIWSKVHSQAMEYGMLWAVRGFGAFALGYALIGCNVKSPIKRTRQGEKKVRKKDHYTLFILKCIGGLSLLAWIASTVLFGVSLVFIEKNLATVNTGHGTLLQILTLLINFRYPFFLAFLVLHYKRRPNRQLVFLFVALLLVSVIEIIIIGSKGAIIRLLVMGVLAQSFLHIRLSFKQVIGGILTLVLVYGSFAVITEYRSIMQSYNRGGSDVFSFNIQLESFKTAVLFSLPFSESSEERRTKVDSETTLNRFGSSMFSFANLMKFTRQQPPYEHALESFFTPVYSFIPRFLMPGKPEFFNSGSNAKKYYGWSYGGISVSLLGSFYYAWGYVGIIFGMFFLGIFLAYIVRQIYMSNKPSIHYLIVFVTLFLFMIDVGVTFQVFVINIIRVMFSLWLLHCIYPLVYSSNRRLRLKESVPQFYRGR